MSDLVLTLKQFTEIKFMLTRADRAENYHWESKINSGIITQVKTKSDSSLSLMVLGPDGLQILD